MNSGQAPGVDGLPVDFYKHFWGHVGADLHEVLLECYKDGVMPTRCRRAVLALLPKKGDLCLLKNWRPVALLCTDYKILSKCLANRLKSHLEGLVKMDQTHCILGRSIKDNLFLIRDMLDVSKVFGLDFGLRSIDQEKAFDRVDHGYLFRMLNAFGLGDGFISWVRLLYTRVACLAKVGGGLSRPVSVQRGIRQGCPLSGQLYTLAIEPFLNCLRAKMKGVLVPGSVPHVYIKMSAYADDITVLVTDQGDLRVLEPSLKTYERASTARVNWERSEALLCGPWNGRLPPPLPGGLQWSRNGCKFLGVHLGTDDYVFKELGGNPGEGIHQVIELEMAVTGAELW